jgi:Fe2+ or Zn2+ uptake regulation protein
MKSKLETEALLKKYGLKVTPKRREILETMSNLAKPATTLEIHESLPRTLKADVATVYRNILTFVEVGLVKQLTLKPNVAHYELDIDHSDHHHIVCTDCGDIEELDGCTLDSFSQSMLSSSKKFTEISGHTFELFGKCKKCK